MFDFLNNQFPEQKRLTLTTQQYVQQAILTRNSLQLANWRVDGYLESFADNFVLRLSAQMAGQVVETHKYPKTWKDAFKERWFPKFLLKKYPVNYVTVETWHCYPEYALPENSYGRPIQFLVTE